MPRNLWKFSIEHDDIIMPNTIVWPRAGNSISKTYFIITYHVYIPAKSITKVWSMGCLAICENFQSNLMIQSWQISHFVSNLNTLIIFCTRHALFYCNRFVATCHVILAVRISYFFNNKTWHKKWLKWWHNHAKITPNRNLLVLPCSAMFCHKITIAKE